MADAGEIPLFPLGIVVLPGEAVPLHIFEDRYKAMIARCLEDESEFGIVWLGEDGLRDIGCACRVERVLERFDDGRLNLLARGTRPFRIEERRDDLPYPAGRVTFLEDAGEADDERAGAARAEYVRLVEAATDDEADPETIAAMSAYEMAGTVDFGPDAKQGLLELRSEPRRMELLARLLRAARKRLEMARAADERARSNGKVRFGGPLPPPAAG